MAQKWIVREGSKSRGFRYKGPSGNAVKDKRDLERIEGWFVTKLQGWF